MNKDYLFYLGILFSSLDSFPIFSSISTYAPYISVLLFLSYLIFSGIFNRNRYSTSNLICLLLSILLYALSLFNGIFVYRDLSGFINFTIQFTLAIFLYKSFNCYFSKLDRNTYLQTFSRIFITYNIPILLIGIIELLLLRSGSLYYKFVSFFSWRVTNGRIQLVSGEPAWAARLILVLLALLPLTDYSKKRKLHLTILLLLLLLATGSSLGIICAMIYYIIVYFRKRYLKYIIIGSLFMVFMFPFVYNHLDDYTKARLELISELRHTNFETLAVSAGSGSFMARIGYPILGINVGLDNPIAGVGGGYYYRHHFTYLSELFPSALNISNIYETGFSPKNLFSRVFAEMGLIGLLPLLIGLYWVFKNVVQRNRQTLGVFVCIILLLINFDSLFHIYPLILFCLLLNYPLKK